MNVIGRRLAVKTDVCTYSILSLALKISNVICVLDKDLKVFYKYGKTQKLKVSIS